MPTGRAPAQERVPVSQPPPPWLPVDPPTTPIRLGGATRRRRHGLLALAAAVVLVAGLVIALLSWPREDPLAAFRSAAQALADTPGLHLTGSGPAGGPDTDARVTAGGESLGTVRTEGQPVELLHVGGQTFLRAGAGAVAWAAGDSAGSVGGTALVQSQLADRWLVVDGLDAQLGVAPVQRPAELAEFVSVAIADPERVEVDADGPVVAGQPTRVARTPTGSVYVTRDEPHRVLRLEAPTGAVPIGYRLSAGSPEEDPELGADRLDLNPLEQEQAEGLYDELSERSGELAEAADATLKVDFIVPPQVACTPAACTATFSVVARVHTSGTVTASTASADVTVEFTVAGSPAGTCRQRVPITLDSPITISCPSPEAGQVGAAALEREKRAALARLRPGQSTQVEVPIGGQVAVVVRAQVAVEEVRRRLAENRSALSDRVSLTGAELQRRHDLGVDPAIGGRYRKSEEETALRVEQKLGITLQRHPEDQGPDWTGSDGKTYDAVGNFPARYFDRQWASLQTAIRDHLGKADLVPVDVAQFTPAQIAQVRAFVEPLAPRVFLVGD